MELKNITEFLPLLIAFITLIAWSVRLEIIVQNHDKFIDQQSKKEIDMNEQINQIQQDIAVMKTKIENIATTLDKLESMILNGFRKKTR